MIGWRGRIGNVVPAVWRHCSEYYPVLPEGVAMHVLTLGLERVVPEEIERIFDMYLPAAKRLAQDECNCMVLSGSPIFTYMGYDRSSKLAREVEEATGIPTIFDLQAWFGTLDELSARKIVMVSPYEEARNEERKKLCEERGYEVVNMKGLGAQRPGAEMGKLPPHASYRLAMEAFLETPDCDVIWVLCPGWPVIRNIEKLETDTGKPVVTTVTAITWSALRAMHIMEPIKGFGKLLETRR